MAETEYEKYIIREPFNGGCFTSRLFFAGTNYFPNTNFWLRAFSIQLPFEMEKPHAHDFDQLFFFLGSPEDMTIFPGEVELYLGKESTKVTKVIINSTSVAYVPAGMFHCPIRWTRVDKPMFFLNMTLSPTYDRVGHGINFRDRLDLNAKKVTSGEASRILGAALPQPAYLPEGCKVQDIYAENSLIRLLVSDKKIEKKQPAPGSESMKLLISEEEIKKRGANVGNFAFSPHKAYIFESRLGIGIKWHPQGKAGGLKLYGESIPINKSKGILIEDEMHSELWWLLPEKSTPKKPGQYEIVIRAGKLMPKEELIKVAQSITT